MTELISVLGGPGVRVCSRCRGTARLGLLPVIGPEPAHDEGQRRQQGEAGREQVCEHGSSSGFRARGGLGLVKQSLYYHDCLAPSGVGRFRNN
jgi:hypothetical protein